MKQYPLLELDSTLTVTGSRSIQDKQFVFSCLDDFLKTFNLSPKKLTLNSGHAKGVDTLAEEWAKVRGVKVKQFIPDWSVGRHAGMIRNKQMVDECQYVCAVYDGVSKGTLNTINHAKKQKKHLKIYEYNHNRRSDNVQER